MKQSHARIQNYHRALCIYSFHHRGTEKKPGLVLGLDVGGSCEGVAFQVAPHAWDATLGYLREREQISMVYSETTHVVELLDTGQKIDALVYVANRAHDQYAGKLSHSRLVDLVQQGEGQMGRCTDYVLNTLAHLKEMDIRDTMLERLGTALRGDVSGRIKPVG